MKLLRSELTALQRIYDYLQEHPTERVSISQLIEVSGMSEAKLTRGFRQVYDESIYQFQLRRTMDYARGLLASGLQVKEVAITLGYSNTNSFSRAFKKVYKDPPGLYKQQ